MAQFTEIPTFVAGEPGFAAKLNQLGAVVAEVIVALEALGEAASAAKAKTAPRKTATPK